MEALSTAINAFVVTAVGLLLARLVNGRFKDVDRRFEEVERRFERVDRRFDDMERRMERFQSSLDSLRSDLTNVALAVGATPRASRREP